MLKIIKYQIFTIIWLMIVFFLSFFKISDYTNPEEGFVFFYGEDKLAHFVFFIVFIRCVLLGYRAQYKTEEYTLRFLFLLFLSIPILGGGIEGLQELFFPYRSVELWDFLMDLFGGSLVVFFALAENVLIYYRKKKYEEIA